MAITRRDYLRVAAQGTVALGALAVASLVPTGTRAAPIRPPGAVDEAYFNVLCVRCGICLEVCPTKAIVFAGFENGIAGVNTPKIDPLVGSCEFYRGRCEESMRCTQHCPAHALQLMEKAKPITPKVITNSSMTIPDYVGTKPFAISALVP